MKKKEKIIISAIVSVLVLALIVVGAMSLTKYISLKTEVENFTEKAQAGDLSVFNLKIENSEEQEIDPDILDLLEEIDPNDPFVTGNIEKEPTTGEKIYQSILQNSKIEYSISPFNNKVNFVVQAPDMENFIKSLNASEIKDENDLYQKMQNYIASGNKKEFTTEIEYHKESGKWVADYTQKDFVNAFTGGMQEGYNNLYSQMLQEIKQNLGVEK